MPVSEFSEDVRRLLQSPEVWVRSEAIRTLLTL
jgi:hypothetical protein